ncbi:HlyD family type I secretion periplasmic adaptor subunit [Vibrio splendidus]|uniref:HlyD family type I secretion periplasmic adaptor subunit n=1 Tax=Vibrio splendidus TaxID=29497 RepID=UPI003D109EAB
MTKFIDKFKAGGRSMIDDTKVEINEVEAAAVFIRRALYAIMILVALSIIWAFFTKIDNYAKAKGEALPIGHVQSIQSLKGGRIDKILIQEGDIVQKGQILVHFDKASAANTHIAAEREVMGLRIEAERLHAFVNETKPDFSNIPEQHRDLIENHVDALNAKNSELATELRILEEELKEENAQLSKLNQEIPAVSEQLSSSEKILTMYEELMKKNIGSKKNVLQEQQTRANIKKEYSSLRGERKTLKIKIASFPLRVEKVKKHYFSETLNYRVQVLNKLREAETKLIEATNNLRHRNVNSPIAGIIKSIPRHSLGSVIQPGGVIAEIVPLNGDIIAEVKIQPKDIGFIKKGQKTILRFDAYEYSQYGVVYGKVLSISPSTFTNKEKHAVYYKVRVKLDTNYVGKNPNLNLIIPGMTLECDIVTDKKTVFQALVKPIYNATQTAFRGR